MKMSKDQNNSLGQGLVEYALILGLVVIIVVVVVTLLGPQVGNMFSEVTGSFPS
jgi:pilus assembly protein Flp/PilA